METKRALLTARWAALVLAYFGLFWLITKKALQLAICATAELL